MSNHVLLDNRSHRELRVSTALREGRGYDANVARVFPSELRQLQLEYPLFFVRNSDTGLFETIALLGFDEGENLFLTDGGWDAEYVPLSIQRQPFLIGLQDREVDGVVQSVPVVHIDLDYPGVGDTDGERLFDADGNPSPYLERVNSILLAIHEGHAASRALSELLVGLELIESLELNVELNDGTTRSIAGLYTINQDKLNALGGNALEVLHRQGRLQDVYMMIASLPNVQALIERKNRRLRT
jgi:hypothetical protein